MNAVPELVPISEVRKRQNEILVQLNAGPVILTQRGRVAAVMVSPEQWNQLIERLKDLEEALEETYKQFKRLKPVSLLGKSQSWTGLTLRPS
jgi:prevent-host-death family protein